MQELKYKDEFIRLNTYFHQLIINIIKYEAIAECLRSKLPSRLNAAQTKEYKVALDNITTERLKLVELNKERRLFIDKEISYMKEKNGKTRTD